MVPHRSPKVIHHLNDLPDGLSFKDSIAVDTEAMGLNPHRDRLCVVQLSGGDGVCHVVQVNLTNPPEAPNLKRLLADPKITKIFHFARFDVAILYHTFGIEVTPIYCTKIASKLARTYTDRHGLKDLCRELLSVDLSKESQSSDWGSAQLTSDQLKYAATDVLHLHALREVLNLMLEREERLEIAQSCFQFLPTCCKLDLFGYDRLSVLEH